ncbi:MAG: hypothetical protein JSR77_01010 [Planctomycetes bacterium]|nr:hypothetical protein [Planctomycetota bacterium]
MNSVEQEPAVPCDAYLAKTRRIGTAMFVCLAAGGFALLIWTKLRVVSAIPRTAYADPAQVHTPVRAPAESPTELKPTEPGVKDQARQPE